LKTTGFSASKLTEKLLTPIRRSLKTTTLPRWILPSPLCGVIWFPLPLGLTPPYCSSAVPIVKPFERTTRPGMMFEPPPVRRVDVVARVRVVRPDRAPHVQLRERDAGGVDADDFLVPRAGRVVLDEDPRRTDVDDVRHVTFERGNPERELARQARAEVAAEDAERVDRQVERAEDPRSG